MRPRQPGSFPNDVVDALPLMPSPLSAVRFAPVQLDTFSRTTANCARRRKWQLYVLRTVRLKQRPVEEGTGSNTVLSASFSKLGQTPPPSIDPPKGMRQAFKDKPQVLDFYKKGLMTLSHGLGLGAVGYFRRVVEESTEELLTLIYEEASLSKGGRGDHEENRSGAPGKEREGQAEDRSRCPPTVSSPRQC